jgi:hypothetical protein
VGNDRYGMQSLERPRRLRAPLRRTLGVVRSLHNVQNDP